MRYFCMVRNVLELENVSFSRNGKHILQDINIRIQAGQRWALIGPNGAGKSTLLSLFGAVNHPTSGTVHVLGNQLGRVDIRHLRESIGHVNPNHPLQQPLTCTQVIHTGATGTIALMLRWDPEPNVVSRAEQLIDLLGLRQVAHSQWSTMSQGERGRTLIARALLANPPLLLLDEPCTGLDVAAREQFLNTIDTLHGQYPDLATVMVTHHFEELPASTTHALLIREGEVLAAGKVDGVLTTPLVSKCFDFPLEIERRGNRWLARIGTPEGANHRQDSGR